MGRRAAQRVEHTQLTRLPLTGRLLRLPASRQLLTSLSRRWSVCPFQLVPPPGVRSLSGCRQLRSPISIARGHHCPNDPRALLGRCDSGNVGLLAFQQPRHPWPLGAALCSHTREMLMSSTSACSRSAASSGTSLARRARMAVIGKAYPFQLHVHEHLQ